MDKSTEFRRKWTQAETAAFVTAYVKRKHEFLDPRLKQYAMENVLRDLIDQAALTSPTTVSMLKSKLKNLWRAYKNGYQETLNAPFQNQLNIMFGSRSEIDNIKHFDEFDMIDTSMSAMEDDESDESECIEARRKWTYEETVEFLNAYAERKNEFLHVRKKKLAMKNVLDDLKKRSVLTQPTTVDMLNTKIKSLWRGYKHVKIHAIKSGVSLASIAFEEQLEAIFGDRPTESNRRSVGPSETSVTLLSTATSDENERNTSEEQVPKKKKTSGLPKYLERKLQLREKYLERKIQLKKDAEINKQKMHAEKIKILHKMLNKFHNKTSM